MIVLLKYYNNTTGLGLDYFRDPEKSLSLTTALYNFLNHHISIPDQHILYNQMFSLGFYFHIIRE